MNMMNNQPSMRVEESDDLMDDEFFTRNPLASLSTTKHEDLESTGWCQCLDSSNNEFFVHSTTGAISYEMPDEQVRHRLSLQHGCMVKLSNALRALDIAESDTELKNIRIQIQTDMTIIEASCSVVTQSMGSATETTDALARAETNLVRLEELATERSASFLWDVARDAMGPTEPVSSMWSTLLDNIHSVRENLRPVHAASELVIDEKEEQNAWVRSLRNKLKPIKY